MISGTVVRSVNIALQTFGIMVALAMMSSFRRDLFRNRSQRLLFSKIVTATVCMICFVIYNLRGIGNEDHLDMILISLSQVGLYVVSYLYIEYLRAQIEELDEGKRVPAAVQIAALVICVAGSTLRVVSTVSGGFGKYGGPDSGSGVTFEIGHLLEDVVAQIFSKKTGLTVYRDQMMYQHPLYPFMLADVDRFVTLPNGKKAILECKTAHYDVQYLWANGAVPRHYELQVRHYMAVMNIDVAYIACLFSNNENDFVWQKIERDLDEEESNILQLQDFWENYVLRRVEPPLTEKPDMVLDALSRYYGPADKSQPTVMVGPEFIPVLERISDLKAQKQILDQQSRKLDDQIKTAYAPIADLMGTACSARCDGNGVSFKISFNPQFRTGISKDKLSQLKAQYPELYDDYVDTTESRVFKLVKSAI